MKLMWVYIAGIALVGTVSLITKARMLDGAGPRADTAKLESDLLQWKLTARSFLDRDEAALEQMSRHTDISPMHRVAVKRMISALRQDASSTVSDDASSAAAKLLRRADTEFLKEEEEHERQQQHVQQEDGDGGGSHAAADPDPHSSGGSHEAWPPPGNWGANTAQKLHTGNIEDLPTWEWDQRYNDMKTYYTETMEPTEGLLKQLKKVMRKTNKNWLKKNIWASYPDEDISDCAKGTPECLFWTKKEVNVSIPEAKVTGSDKNYRKCCIEHRKMRDVTRSTFKVLYNAGIDMWLGDGTLLGARRGHGTVIPWDTDIDVFSRVEDKARIVAALKAAKADGSLPHAWEKDRHGRDMFWVYYSKKRMTGDSHLEIWLTDFKKQKRNDASLVLPLKPCPFYDFTVLCPDKVDRILTIAYGNWQTPDKERKV